MSATGVIHSPPGTRASLPALRPGNAGFQPSPEGRMPSLPASCVASDTRRSAAGANPCAWNIACASSAEQVVEEIHGHWIRRGSYKGQFIANRRMALDREQRRQYHCVQSVQIAYVGNAQRRLALGYASGLRRGHSEQRPCAHPICATARSVPAPRGRRCQPEHGRDHPESAAHHRERKAVRPGYQDQPGPRYRHAGSAPGGSRAAPVTLLSPAELLLEAHASTADWRTETAPAEPVDNLPGERGGSRE